MLKDKTFEEIQKLFIGTFTTELGIRCLEHLEETFVDREMYKHGSTLEQVAFRQGEASIVRKIQQAMKGKRDGR